MKNIICITLLLLCLGFTQASWRRFRHHSFKPEGHNLLQTQAQTETKTEATVATAVETDCDPDCLYKYPYIEGDCSDKAEPSAGPNQPTQPSQPVQQPQAPVQPVQNLPVESLQNEPTLAGPEAPTQGQAIVPPQNEVIPSFPPQGEAPVGSPFPVTEEDDSDESSVYRYPFSNAGAGCPVVSENAEDAIVSTDAPETEVNWEELAPSQPQEGPQYQGGEQIPSGVPPTGPQGFPQDDQEEQGEQGSTDVIEQGYIVEEPSQPSQIVVEDIQGQPEEGQSEEGIAVGQQEPTEVDQGYIVEEPSQAVGEDIQGPYVPEDVQSQPEEIIVESQQESGDVEQGYTGSAEQPPQIVVEDIQGQPEEVQPEEIITGSQEESTDVEQGDVVETSQIVAEDIQGQYVPVGQSEEIIVVGQQQCGGQVTESESGAPQGQEIPFEGQGVVAYDEIVYNAPQPQVPTQSAPQPQSQPQAQPEIKPEVPVYNQYYGVDTPVCSCICSSGGNTFPYSFKM